MLLEVLKGLCGVLEVKPDSVEQRSCISLMDSTIRRAKGSCSGAG
jgi:hypothetical protein